MASRLVVVAMAVVGLEVAVLVGVGWVVVETRPGVVGMGVVGWVGVG